MTAPDTAPAPHRVDTQTKYLIGLIALAATILGAVIGGGAAIYSANLNAKTQTKVAQYNIAHTQIATAFATFLNDQATFVVHEATVGEALKKYYGHDPVDRTTPDDVATDMSLLKTDTEKLRYDSKLIAVITPGSVSGDYLAPGSVALNVAKVSDSAYDVYTDAAALVESPTNRVTEDTGPVSATPMSAAPTTATTVAKPPVTESVYSIYIDNRRSHYGKMAEALAPVEPGMIKELGNG